MYGSWRLKFEIIGDEWHDAEQGGLYRLRLVGIILIVPEGDQVGIIPCVGIIYAECRLRGEAGALLQLHRRTQVQPVISGHPVTIPFRIVIDRAAVRLILAAGETDRIARVIYPVD